MTKITDLIDGITKAGEEQALKGTVNELNRVIRGTSGNGAVATACSQETHAGHAVAKRRLGADVAHTRKGSQGGPHHESLLAHAGRKADSGQDFMSLDDEQGLSDF